MKSKYITIILLLIFPLFTYGQKIKLNKNIKLDTLFVSLKFSETLDEKLKEELRIQFDTIISVFNRNENSFIIKHDSILRKEAIKFEMGPIKYVDAKKNILTTGIDIAALAGTVLILPHFPIIIPFWLMPSTNSIIDINSQPELFTKPAKLAVNPSGYLIKKISRQFV